MQLTRQLESYIVSALMLCFLTNSHLPAQGKGVLSPDLIYSRNKGSVVTILTFDSNKTAMSQGSGFIVAKDRIATNYHVVAGSASASIIFDDGTIVPSNSVTSGSAPKDLVILGANTGKRPPLPLGSELETKVGQSVYAIGAPRGLAASLSNGLVSAFREDEGQFLIQITASIAPGSSGGPLFDREGRVIGITTSRLTDGSFGFAVGVSDLQLLLKAPLPVPITLSDLKKETSPAEEKTLASAQALFEQKKYAEAAKVIETLPDSTKNSYDAQFLLCRLDNELHDGHAIQSCDTAIHMRPTEGKPYEQKAYALFVSRDLEGAEENATEAVQLSDDPDAKQLLGLMYYIQEKYTLVSKELSEESDDPFVLTLLEGAALRNGDKDAFHRLEARIDALKGAANGWKLYLDGAAAQRNLNFAVALDDYRKCGEDSDFVDPVCAISLAQVEFIQGSRMQAETHINSSIQRYFNSPSVISEAIFIELAMGNMNKAKSLHDQLKSVSFPQSDSTDCLYYYGTNQPALAESSCAAAVTANENLNTAWSNAGYVALDLGEYPTALTDFAKAYQLYSASTRKHTASEELDLSWGLLLAGYFTGNRKDARELYSDLKKSYPDLCSMSALKELPLVWSDHTQNLINIVIKDFK